ncbi:MAG: tetratricopeptide repeat protein [Haliea sp.]|nr:tetratricopeptide repeat protein [Haliea sp.]
MGRHADALIAASNAAALALFMIRLRAWCWERAVARRPAGCRARRCAALVLQSPESADAHFELAKLLQGPRAARASASLEQALLLAPERIDINVLKGELLLAEGETDAALAIALRLQEAHPGSPEGDILAGRTLMAQQQPEAAIAAYEQAVAKSAARGPMMKLQAAYRQIGNAAKADVILRNWLSAHANDVPIRIMLATSMMQADELDLAEREYLQALNYQPDNAILHNNLAWLYSQSADPRAEEHARRALELLPDNPNVLDTYGWILAQGESPHQGLALLEKAIERSPGDALIRYHLAGTLALVGQPYQARRELETILESNQTVVDKRGARTGPQGFAGSRCRCRDRGLRDGRLP